jgi:hypothetical protein
MIYMYLLKWVGFGLTGYVLNTPVYDTQFLYDTDQNGTIDQIEYDTVYHI